MTDSRQLLLDYTETGSETAFRELVVRYVDLVHSAAVRLVNDAHLAEDVAQTVFTDLARMAPRLSREVMLGGWLHRHTCFVASNLMRRERRRQWRERQAVAMNSTEDHSAANLDRVAPVLDVAIDQLAEKDRRAILLRFFEQRDFRSIGAALGGSEEAARKRVNRALDKLHGLLTRRGIVLSATALATTMASGAVKAAPATLAATISTAALAGAATATGGATALTILNIMSTKMKVGLAGAIVAAGMAIPLVMQHQDNNRLAQENAALILQAEQVGDLAAENIRLAGLLAARENYAPPSADDQLPELLRLRGEIGRLRQQIANAPIGTPKSDGSLLGELTANPEMIKVLREQQRIGLSMIYNEFAKLLDLPPEQAEKLNDLLADHVMDNIDLITAVLREGKTPEEREWLFARQEAILLEQVRGLLGSEALSDYQDYTRDLLGRVTAEQFKGKLAGDSAEKNEKARLLHELLRDETQLALAAAGLHPDFQAVPTLNFRNFGSEEEAEKNLRLLDDIYQNATVRAVDFLTPEEIQHFGEFRAAVINGNRMALTLNRKMMMPGSN